MSSLAEIERATAHCPNVALFPRSGRWLALFLPLLLLLSGCGTTTNYTSNRAALPPKPPGYPIPLYSLGVTVPRPCEVIGHVAIGDTQLTMFGGSFQGVLKTLMATAHEKGADAVQLLVVEKPDFTSAHFRLQASLLRYATGWETVTLAENDFLKYLQQHRQTLDPIEGIWSDGSTDRLWIIKDAAQPGRDFIAFIPNPSLASWHKGYKKMDIARMPLAGAYRLTYYGADFVGVNTGLRLDQNGIMTFYLPVGEEEYRVAFAKIIAPPPAP